MTELKKMDNYQQYIHQSKYARWIEEEKRRESWEETVGRYIEFWYNRFGNDTGIDYKELEQAIVNMEVMPSMRCMMSAGEALEQHNVAGYNCAYATIKHPKVFSEILYILMCGTGVGFSVESKYVNKLPGIPENIYDTDTTIHVADSKIGWAKAYKELISLLYAGQRPQWNTDKVRRKGERLKTFGGRASGPEPLEELFRFTCETFERAKDRRLTSIECHDIVCKIADCVVVGGVRRSALISLSDLHDPLMRTAKSGNWYITHPFRSNANNSAVYESTPDILTFIDEWKNLYESKSGERGIFNREAARNTAALSGRRNTEFCFGTNPCSEIILRDAQFCNLTEVVVRAEDDLVSIKRKVRIATILGTLQSTLTDFKFLSSEWRNNCEEERLLGVSLTGIMDSSYLYNSGGYLGALKKESIETNKVWAEKLGINQSAAITCVKPSGTVSQLVNSSSGIHARFAPYYIRRVRENNISPIRAFLVDKGVPNHPEPNRENDVTVFDFPIQSPKSSVVVKDLSAIQQLEMWQDFALDWCEHKPSCTVYYSDEEFMEVGAWIYKNFDLVSGISFFPKDDHIYQLPPYEEITEEEYEELMKGMPEINWHELQEYEYEDTTTSGKELACAAGVCEV